MVPGTHSFNLGRHSHKRSHIKSRNGCSACKSRRVKCDEQHPSCSNCQRRGENCEYVPPGPIYKKRKSKRIHGDEGLCSSSPDGICSSSSGYQPDGMVSPATDDSPSSVVSATSFQYMKNIYEEYKNDSLIDPDLISFNNNLRYVKDDFEEPDPEENYEPKLASVNSAQTALPNYMCYTTVNSKLFAYYQSTYHKRISNKIQVLRPWTALSGIANMYPYAYHIIMSVAASSLYYDALNLAETGTPEPVLGLRTDQYKQLADLHYKAFLEQFDIMGVSRSKDAMELFTYMAASTLHLLYHILAPATTLCDPFFFQISRTGSLMYKELLPFTQEADCSPIFSSATANDVPQTLTFYEAPSYGRIKKSVIKVSAMCLDMQYYASHSVPVVSQNAWLFFPRYLYQIADRQPFEPVDQYNGLNVDHTLFRSSLDLLRREYNLVYNTQEPEGDSIRVLLRWPALVSKSFVDLLTHQDQRCLIVIAHFVMLLASLDFDRLFPRRMLRKEINNIDSVVDEDWRPWLDLPKRVVGLL